MNSLFIPNSVDSIGYSAFESCGQLTTVTIENGLLLIDQNAFRNCNSLSSITIPASVNRINNHAFEGCSSLKVIYSLPETPPTIETNTFTDYNVPVIVQKGCLNAYKTHNVWKKFNNLSDQRCYKLTYIVDGEVYKTIEVEVGASIEAEGEPTKDGYDFSGWSEIPETMPAKDVTVTGTFTVNKYKLTYMIDNEVYKVVEYDYGAAIVPEGKPEGDYVTFVWKDVPKTMPAKDVTVYADYETGIAEVLMAQGIKYIFAPNGKRIEKLQKGLNIVVMYDGTVRKVVVK